MKSEMSGGQALVGEKERQNSIIFLCVCISALVLLYSAGESFASRSAQSRNSMCNTPIVFVGLWNGQVTDWLTDCLSD